MPAIRSRKPTAAQLLEAVEQLPPEDLDGFLKEVNALRARRNASCLAGEEALVLQKINEGFSAKWWDHYHRLIAKRQRQSLSAKELRELIKLTDQIEEKEGKRMEALVQLAQLRGQNLSEVLTELGLPTPNND